MRDLIVSQAQRGPPLMRVVKRLKDGQTCAIALPVADSK